ncbi:general odorant-binding protein 45-like [Wyeomyia smithii]|uniref:general odorant-binding protein 45-like n=1 Tax=Wyeomyia smithii TaxID=174621 RepID=UPI002467E16C|nr:general odorant-binding protein 45-like [Wyeomyia smithii]
MKGIATALVFAAYSTLVLADLPHYTTYKSFQTAFYECAEYYHVPNCTVRRYIEQAYPAEEEVKKLIRCTLINLAAWDDDTGVRDYVISKYFVPSPDDTCYERRTRECLDNMFYDCRNSRAYESFKCYYRYYGELTTNSKYVPYELLEGEQLALTGLKIAKLPYEVLVQYCKGDIENEEHFPDLMYLLLVRGGYYSPQSGWNLANWYTQLGDPSLLDPSMQQCIDNAEKEKCNADEVSRLFLTWQRCFSQYYYLRKYIQIAAKTLVGDPNGCLCTKSFYNQH